MSVVDDIDDIDFLRACLAKVDGFLAEMPADQVITRMSFEAHRKDLVDRIAEIAGGEE